jgi:predicted HNH restriction endonuclease
MGTRMAMNPVTDLAVLCSNCHRMMADEIERFKREHFHG